MTTDSKIYSKSWLLTPGECNCEKEMSVWLMTERIIDVATEHANSWGVGYARLILDNQAWVLSRVAIEMKRWPKVNETYTLSTWVEDYNRHFSERNIEVTDTDGNVIGHARTVWVVIDLRHDKAATFHRSTIYATTSARRSAPLPSTHAYAVSTRQGLRNTLSNIPTSTSTSTSTACATSACCSTNGRQISTTSTL